MMMQLKKITIKGNKLILNDDKIIYLTKEMFSKFDLKDKTSLDDENLEIDDAIEENND